MLRIYDSLEEVLGKILRCISSLCMALLLILACFNIINRTFGLVTMAWYEEIVTFLFAWMGFLAAAELWRCRMHFRVDFLYEKLPQGKIRMLAQLVLDVLCLIFVALTLVYSAKWVMGIRSTTAALKMPTSVLYSSIPVSMALMLMMTVRDIIGDVADLFGSSKG